MRAFETNAINFIDAVELLLAHGFTITIEADEITIQHGDIVSWFVYKPLDGHELMMRAAEAIKALGYAQAKGEGQ